MLPVTQRLDRMDPGGAMRGVVRRRVVTITANTTAATYSHTGKTKTDEPISLSPSAIFSIIPHTHRSAGTASPRARPARAGCRPGR